MFSFFASVMLRDGQDEVAVVRFATILNVAQRQAATELLLPVTHNNPPSNNPDPAPIKGGHRNTGIRLVAPRHRGCRGNSLRTTEREPDRCCRYAPGARLLRITPSGPARPRIAAWKC